MTITQSIASWIQEYDDIEIPEITTDQLDIPAESCGIIKGTASNYREFIDGTKLFVQYFQFVTRRFSQTEEQRSINHEWLQGLEEFIDLRNVNGDLPEFEDNYTCEEININNSFFVYSTSEEESIYQMTLEVIFKNF